MIADFASLLALLMVEQAIRAEASPMPNNALSDLEQKNTGRFFINFSYSKKQYKAMEGTHSIPCPAVVVSFASFFCHFNRVIIK
jgi:hypothetical protein